MTAPLLEVEDLTVEFAQGGGLFKERQVVRAVDGVSFSIGPGRTVGLVGESGCGKSTTGLAVMRLVGATGGRVTMEGQDMLTASGRALRDLRQKVQIIFQDPFSSLNPRLTAAQVVAEPLDILGVGTRAERRARVDTLLQQVGLTPEQGRLFPHQFSGGQRQRLGIARALAPAPRLVVCDEPVSALDVAIQAQILNLLARIQRDTGIAMLFISHDLSVVKHISDDVIVMYLGRIVERGPVERIFGRPMHPYTQALLAAIPSRDPEKNRARARVRLTGDVPSPMNVPSGCAFRTRCPFAREACATDRPNLRELGGGQAVACHFAEEIASQRTVEPTP